MITIVAKLIKVVFLQALHNVKNVYQLGIFAPNVESRIIWHLMAVNVH